MLALVLAAVHPGVPVRAAEPATLSSARLGLAQLDHRLADLQARTGAKVEALNMRQGRALIAEQWLYSARETARASGFLVRNNEARRLLMTSPPPQVVTYSRALIRYHRLL